MVVQVKIVMSNNNNKVDKKEEAVTVEASLVILLMEVACKVEKEEDYQILMIKHNKRRSLQTSTDRSTDQTLGKDEEIIIPDHAMYYAIFTLDDIQPQKTRRV
eukprot:CAMPEP_0176373672 /NCGR_PEP_ID=MMETSP0126-20121128/26201_1 /TAXON_ID=141414 ORGANISM="Strombidinopsis acuminatum, Strain SPMC142" /NCGR_SAMPLE_ID=MMETSP0126 /ASSEMBLY_ACC=CAM_ASM_000229 /LENGTH=102 /DNA_ID=CAMNT_0017733901 /DNA_START=1157 /DNA_END=1464 /DNA_ORIENTATION=+